MSKPLPSELKSLSYQELQKLLDDPNIGDLRFAIYNEWVDRASCSRYNSHGVLDTSTGIFTTVDGHRFKSIGMVSYGNNNDYEVMVPEVKPPDSPSPFAGTPFDNYPVFFASHDEVFEDNPVLGESKTEFLQEVPECHLNSVLMQLGGILFSYK